MTVFVGLVFKCRDTFEVTGRGLVVLCEVLKGGDKPETFPFPVYWTDPAGEDRESVVTGIERFAKFLDDDFERGDRPAGLLVRAAQREDFAPGTILYAPPTRPRRG